ncbi:MAG: IPT/TIG domain-containing protein [Reichenbachiella sp.]
MKIKLSNLINTLAYLLILISCTDAEIAQKEYPLIFMSEVETDGGGVTFHARIESLGQQEIISYGFVWNQIDDNDNFENWYRKVLDEPITTGLISSSINSDLLKDYDYVVRPFVVTPENTIYGTSIQFTSTGSKTPEVLSYSPKEGFDGTLVKLEGKNFSLRNENISIFVENTKVDIIRSSEDSLVFKIPQSAFVGNAELRIEVGDQEVRIGNGFKIFGPEIDIISKTEGYSGDMITIEGSYFTQNGETKLFFNDYEAEIVEIDSNQITAIVPIPSHNLLADNYAEIIISSGAKRAVYSPSFKIEKSWRLKSATPFSWGYAYKSFTYNDFGYILELNDKKLYSYNPTTDEWQSGSTFPGNRDGNNLFIVNENKLLKMSGSNYSGTVNFIWEYDFDSQIWTQQKGLPFSFEYATYFNLDGKAFIVTNFGEVWSYEFSSKIFTRQNDFPETSDWSGFSFAFTDDDDIFLITYGANWQYDMNTDSWLKISNNIFDRSSYSQNAIGFYSNNTAYVIEDGEYLYKYNRQSDNWSLASMFPGCRGDNSYKTVFSIQNKAYVAATSGSYGGCSPLLYEYSDIR